MYYPNNNNKKKKHIELTTLADETFKHLARTFIMEFMGSLTGHFEDVLIKKKKKQYENKGRFGQNISKSLPFEICMQPFDKR